MPCRRPLPHVRLRFDGATGASWEKVLTGLFGAAGSRPLHQRANGIGEDAGIRAPCAVGPYWVCLVPHGPDSASWACGAVAPEKLRLLFHGLSLHGTYDGRTTLISKTWRLVCRQPHLGPKALVVLPTRDLASQVCPAPSLLISLIGRVAMCGNCS